MFREKFYLQQRKFEKFRKNRCFKKETNKQNKTNKQSKQINILKIDNTTDCIEDEFF